MKVEPLCGREQCEPTGEILSGTKDLFALSIRVKEKTVKVSLGG